MHSAGQRGLCQREWRDTILDSPIRSQQYICVVSYWVLGLFLHRNSVLSMNLPPRIIELDLLSRDAIL